MRLRHPLTSLLFFLSICAPASAAYTTIVANLPTCVGNRNGQIISVADGVDYADCSTGGATGTDRHVVACQCDTLNALGPYWKAVGGGAGGAGDVLLAGDADGQVIQGISGSDQARVDIGVTDVASANLLGSGATPATAFADNQYAGIKSPDTNTSCIVSNGVASCSSDVSVLFQVTPGGYFGATSTSFYAGSPSGATSIDLSDGALRVTYAQTPPTNANDTCTAGDTIDTATFHYFCHATDSWVRAPMASW